MLEESRIAAGTGADPRMTRPTAPGTGLTAQTTTMKTVMSGAAASAPPGELKGARLNSTDHRMAPHRPTNLRILWVVGTELAASEDPGAITFLRAPPAGLDIELLVLSGRKNHSGEPEQVRGSGSVRFLSAGGPTDFRGLIRFLRLVRTGQHDLIHAHGLWAGLWGAIARKVTGTPLVATLNDLPRPEAPGRLLERFTLRMLQRQVDRVVALSGAQWDRYIRQRLFSRAVLEVVHPGIPAQLVPVRSPAASSRLKSEAGFPSDTLVAVTIHPLDRHTGVDLLLWAMPAIVEAIPAIRFVIVGDGERKSELQRRVRARGLNRFVHWREVPEDPGEILSGGDLLIHPSLQDTFPIVVLQAMAAGIPVVATRVGGVPEVLGSARMGRLVSSTNPEALALAVVDLARSPDELREAGVAARKRAEERFSARQWATTISGIYGTVVADARSGRPRRLWPSVGLDVDLIGLRRLRGSGGHGIST